MPGTSAQIIRKLEEQEKAEGKLSSLLKFYKQLLAIQNRVEHKIETPHPVFTDEALQARIREGKPLVGFTDLALDWSLLRQTYREVVALFSQSEDLFGKFSPEVIALPPGRVINMRTVRAWYRGKKIPLPVTLSGTSETHLNAIFAAALQPFLKREATVLSPRLDTGTWRRGYCPVCGGNPDFAYLERETGARWLVCSRCDTEWIFQRMQCPYCGNAGQDTLSFFTTDVTAYRLYVCEVCKHYIKAIDLRQVSGEAFVSLERLTTLDLDRQAQEKGYFPCA